jgi:hypothetical protein
VFVSAWCTSACPGRLGRAWTSRAVSVALAPLLRMCRFDGRAERKGCCSLVGIEKEVVSSLAGLGIAGKSGSELMIKSESLSRGISERVSVVNRGHVGRFDDGGGGGSEVGSVLGDWWIGETSRLKTEAVGEP